MIEIENEGWIECSDWMPPPDALIMMTRRYWDQPIVATLNHIDQRVRIGKDLYWKPTAIAMVRANNLRAIFFPMGLAAISATQYTI